MNSTLETIDYKKFPILYIDDLKNNLESFETTFKKDFTLLLAESAEGALKLLEKEWITVIIADQRMPKMTGVEFFKIIKDKYPQIIRILITAYSDIGAVIAAINEGKVYSYIGKPVKDDDVRERIKQGIYTYCLTQERDRLYQEKLDAMKKLARSNRLNTIMSMSYGMADRISNYLFSINMFIGEFPENLEKLGDKLTSEEKEKLKVHYTPGATGLDKMLRLSHEIVSLCKPPTYNFQKYEPRVIMDIADESAKELKTNKDIKIDKTIEGNPPATYFDRNAIKQVLWHLIQNSIHAIPETTKGGVISVKVTGPISKSGREFTRIIVQDNGVGIPKESLEDIFNPFFTTKGTSGGLGLGLTTCQFIITQHEGEIEVAESELDKGTTIIVDLPIKAEPPKPAVDYKDILGEFPARRKA